MRWLINYIRSCFCKHDLELLKRAEMWDGDNPYATMAVGSKWIYRCKKCGWHTIIKDY